MSEARMHFRNVLLDGVLVHELLEFKDEHDSGHGTLSVTLKLNVKKIEIDSDVIRITSYKPPDANK